MLLKQKQKLKLDSKNKKNDKNLNTLFNSGDQFKIDHILKEQGIVDYRLIGKDEKLHINIDAVRMNEKETNEIIKAMIETRYTYDDTFYIISSGLSNQGFKFNRKTNQYDYFLFNKENVVQSFNELEEISFFI